MKELDVTGLSCPEPVVRTRAAQQRLAPGEPLTVLTDTATARDNIARSAAKLDWRVRVDAIEGRYRLTLTR